jgi:hypothetical protein
LSGGCKLFSSAVVKTELKSVERIVGDKSRRGEEETGSEDDDGEQSLCAGISSASSSFARAETLISSLNAIFEVYADDDYNNVLSSHLTAAFHTTAGLRATERFPCP